MAQFTQTQKSQTTEKPAIVGIQSSPYKVYANLERVRSSNEVCLEVIDGYLKQPESLVLHKTELLKTGIFCVILSVTEKEEYSTYFRSEPIALPPTANSLLIKILKNGKQMGFQHINLQSEILSFS